MTITLILLTWLLIFIATRESMSFNKRRYFYVAAIVVSAIAMTISIMTLINQIK